MTANRTLDIHNVIETERLESKEPEKTVADILPPFLYEELRDLREEKRESDLE